MTRTASRAIAAVAGLAAAGVLVVAPPAQAETTKTTREKVCVTVHRDGELTHRYVLIRHIAATYDDAGQVTSSEPTPWHRVPQRFYPHRWQRLCG